MDPKQTIQMENLPNAKLHVISQLFVSLFLLLFFYV